MTRVCRGEKLVVYLRCLGIVESLRVRLGDRPGSKCVEVGLVILLEQRLLVESVVDREVAMDGCSKDKLKLCPRILVAELFGRNRVRRS